MITNLVEGKKTKCEQYWPSSGSQDFGPFHISITQQLTLADYIIRTLSVELSGKTRKVNHFHYTAWPDHGVPDYATSILNFHKMVMKDHKAHRGPLLVHCRATRSTGRSSSHRDRCAPLPETSGRWSTAGSVVWSSCYQTSLNLMRLDLIVLSTCLHKSVVNFCL
ncbi:Receptor-type tyrosine-protein phosphatase S [Geodia barretti]|uniref:protein-tyrosine-phosphatase n=1 Tax=Geodia barretti TaxID=519541 RepID=A0AA35TUU1_GEOBA|nr:Receptor-type tyrosine-protein phosphatase S [Geodia barretti]